MEASYAQQEAKATGREAKVRWAREEGVSVQSIQHDCVVLVVGRVGPDGRRPMRNTALFKAVEGAALARWRR